jgi:LmbE family N-acetylglucosaminyl deacetylase
MLHSGNGVVVVAHPDDETLWAGGFLAEHPGTTVICCTIPRRDPERALKFYSACKKLRAFPILLPIMEELPSDELKHLDLLKDVHIDDYDWIMTHNEKGEYGHIHHKSVHDWVKKNTNNQMYVFGYGMDGADYELSQEVWAVKESALKCYDNHSNADGGKPKWEALMDTYDISKDRETFYVER